MSYNNKIGILDPEGKNINPLNDKQYSSQYTELAKKWSAMPAYTKAEEIISTIEKNQVTIIVSSTGSGKTVLIPKFVSHIFNYKSKIAVTLPKQIIAKSSAEFAAKTLDVELGSEIGYKFKGENKMSNSTKILYATDGTIVSKLMNDPELKEFDSIIIDEAHERKVQIDFLLYLLRNTVKLRTNFKLVIMSATINEKLFESYFKDFKCSSIFVGVKQNYEIEKNYLKSSTNNYLANGYEIIKKISSENSEKNDESKDIIFFVPSVSEALEICKKINDDKLDIYCVEVYSGMDPEKEELALDKDKFKIKSGKSRKVIMATGVAESSVTFNGIKYVIDSGYELFGYHDPTTNAKVIEKRRISKAQSTQRAGRVGRTESGTCYFLYTEKEQENMINFPEPNIRTSNLYQECLKMLSYENVQTTDKLKNMFKDFIEPPTDTYINNSIEQLTDLMLVHKKKITNYGKEIVNIQANPKFAVALHAGFICNIGAQVAGILAMLEACKYNLGELFMYPEELIKKSDNANISNITNKFNKAYEDFCSPSGDIKMLYKIFNEFGKFAKNKDDEKIKHFCYKYFIKRKVLDKAKILYAKYKNEMFKFKNKVEIKSEDIPIFKHHKMALLSGSVLCGFVSNIAELNNKTFDTKFIKNIRANKNSTIHCGNRLPDKVMYIELFKYNSVDMNIVSKVNDSVMYMQKMLYKKIQFSYDSTTVIASEKILKLTSNEQNSQTSQSEVFS